MMNRRKARIKELESPWIKIMPETMPKDIKGDFLVKNYADNIKIVHGCDERLWSFSFRFYMLIPKEKE